METWLKDDDIEIYSTHNQGKSVVTERFIRTLKNKICKYMTSVSKNVYIDKLYDIVNKHLKGRKLCGRNSCGRYFRGIYFCDFALKPQN